MTHKETSKSAGSFCHMIRWHLTYPVTYCRKWRNETEYHANKEHLCISIYCIKVISYRAQCTVLMTAQSILRFIPWQTSSTKHRIWKLLWEASDYCTKNNSNTDIHHSSEYVVRCCVNTPIAQFSWTTAWETSSRWQSEFVMAACCPLFCLTYTWRTSCKMQ